MNSLAIPTLDAGGCEIFLRNFYATEQPVVLRNVATTSLTAEAICHQLNARISRDPAAAMQTSCWDVRPELIADLCTTPSPVREALNDEKAFRRERYVRIWFNLKGHKTPWHYDGNSLHVFNLQLKGRKRWRIVAPETPLLCMPFTIFCLFGEYSLARRRHYEFETGEGDLIFLPRYWYHNVESLEPLNININWVLTTRREPADNASARREAELTWLRARLRPVLSKSARKYIDEYAGAGEAAVALVTRGVSIRSGLTRAIKETLKLFLVLPGLLSQLSYLKAVRRSKRVMRGLVAAERAAEKRSHSASAAR